MADPSLDQLPLDSARRVDACCADFEAALRQGLSPASEPYLLGLNDAERQAVLREMLLIELEYRRDAGDKLSVDHLLARWPLPRQTIQELFDRTQAAALPIVPPVEATVEFTAEGRGSTISAPSSAGPTAAPIGAPRDWNPPGYEIVGELGRGGMGVVYEARQPALDRTVAIKSLLSEVAADSQALSRFRNEATALGRLQHAHITRVYEVGALHGRPFLCLEMCGGGSLASRLDEKPWPPEAAAELLETLANAVHAAHEVGVIHRDLKPANVLFTADGTPKISDFGLAKLIEQQEGPTASGSILGTPSYMAPEQAAGATGSISRATDVYGLGALLYRLLVGRPPFQTATPMTTLRQVIEAEPAPPRRLDASLSVDLETICLKCLEKRPERRYAAARELAEDLQRYRRGQPIRARRTGAFEQAVKFAVRRPLAATVLILLASIASNVLRTLLSLDPQTMATIRNVSASFAWNSLLTTLAAALLAVLYGLIHRMRHRPPLLESVFRCVLAWLALKIVANLIAPFLPFA